MHGGPLPKGKPVIKKGISSYTKPDGLPTLLRGEGDNKQLTEETPPPSPQSNGSAKNGELAVSRFPVPRWTMVPCWYFLFRRKLKGKAVQLGPRLLLWPLYEEL